MKALDWSFAALVAISVLSIDVSAAECPGGSTSAEECLLQLKKLEVRLLTTYAVEETRLVGLYSEPDYGGLSGKEYSTELVKAFRARNAAWRSLRDKECWYVALSDGMSLSPDYASPVAEACKVRRTLERIKEFER